MVPSNLPYNVPRYSGHPASWTPSNDPPQGNKEIAMPLGAEPIYGPDEYESGVTGTPGETSGGHPAAAKNPWTMARPTSPTGRGTQ